MTLGSTQRLTEMSTRSIFWTGGGKGGRCVRLTDLTSHVPNVLKYGSLKLLEYSGPVQACTGIIYLLTNIKFPENTLTRIPKL
jgi:hypothetical protein